MPGVPYAFAHPLAVIPLQRLLGRYGSASALVIGSVIPDAWYFLPFLGRADSHSLGGLLLFCLPSGLFAYAAFHLIFKEPLLALLPPALGGRLHCLTFAGLPPAPWPAAVASILAGASTHLAWDALTHPGLMPLSTLAHQILQHASTVLGTAFLCCWIFRKLRAMPAGLAPAALSLRARIAISSALAALCVLAFWRIAADIPASDLQSMRSGLRAAGVTAASVLGFATLVYCVAWRARSLH